MKISRDRFEEILSAYLDAEASPEELELLAKCVREDATMASLYYKSCRVHFATCKMFGKKAVFVKLDGVDLPNFEPKKISKVKIAIEWSAVAALMLLSFSLFYLAVDSTPQTEIIPSQKSIVSNQSEYKQIEAEVSTHSVVEDGEVFSVIKMRAKSPIFTDVNR